METDPEAQRTITDYAEDAARRSGLPEPQRSDARRELHSHLWDAARAAADQAGADHVDLEHARAAIEALGSRDDVDAAFFAIHRAELERAPFTTRTVAYVLDFVLAMIAFNIILGPVMFLAFAPFSAFGSFADIDCDPSPFGIDCSGGPLAPGWIAPIAAFWTVVSFVAVILAFAAFEATIGQTPGKMVLRLRATTSGGGPLSWREAILRNITKAFPLLLLLDAVLGHFAYRHTKERISDHIAGTAVIREAR